MFRLLFFVFLTSLVASVPATRVVAQSPLMLDENGLGSITADTRFDVETLRRILPNTDWQVSTRATEAGAEPVIFAMHQGKIGFTIRGDGAGRVAGIKIVSRHVGNRLGPRVGDAYRQLKRDGRIAGCWPGREVQSGHVLCRAAETARVVYVFSGRWSGPDGQMPPADVLNDWTVLQILWHPERLVQGEVLTPAFDCGKAQGSVELLICDSAELARLDRQLTDVYAQKLAAMRPTERRRLRAEQRGWIKGRNDCWKSADPHRCVAGAYSDRIGALRGATSLIDTSWRGVRIAGDRVLPGIDIHVSFGADGRLSGSSGCNRVVAAYELSGQNLTIRQPAGTRRLCPELEMLAEHRFLNALEQVNGWALRNGDLILFGSGAELTFRPM